MGIPARFLKWDQFTLLVFILFSLLVVGGIKKIHDYSIKTIHTRISNELTEKAEFISRTINPLETDIYAIDGTNNDHPEYIRLTEQLSNYHNYTDAKNIFTLLRQDDKIFLGPMSTANSGGSVPEDKKLTESLLLNAEIVYNGGDSRLISNRLEPEIDHITTLAPLLDSRSGEVLLIVGIDWSKSKFIKPVKQEKRILNLIGISFILILLTGSLLIYIRGTKKFSDNKILPYSGVFITAALCLVTTLLFVHLFSIHEKNKHHDVFTQLSNSQAFRLHDIFNGFHDNDLIPMMRLMEMDEDLTKDEFSFFSRKVYRKFRMAALGWAPKVFRDERKGFVEQTRRGYYKDFDIFENVRFLGKMVQTKKDFYFPLLYIEPFDEIQSALGWDLASDTLRWQAIQTAINTGLPTLTDKIYRFTNNEPSFNVYAPVYRFGIRPAPDATFQEKLDQVRGVVYLTLRLNLLLKESIYDQNSENPALMIDLFQLVNNSEKKLVVSTYRDNIVNDFPVNTEISDSYRFSKTYPLFLFGKSYLLVVKPGKPFYAAHPERLFWVTLTVGLLLTMLLTFFHFFVTRRKLYLESQLSLRNKDVEKQRVKLEQLNNHFQSLAQQSKTFLWEVDSDGLITFVSELSKKVIGYKPTELAGKKFIWELLPDEKIEQFRAFLINSFIKKKEFTDIEIKMVASNKHSIWVSLSGIPIFDQNYQLKGYRGSLSDITERKKALDAEILLRQKEEQQILLDNIPTQVWYFTTFNTYGSVNKAHADFLGVSASNIMFRNVYDVIPKEMGDAFCKGNIQVFQNCKPLNIEVWVSHVSGRRLISIHKHPKLNHEGNVEYVVCSAEDITEQKKAEEALRLSGERYRTLTENAFVGIYLMYGRNFEYVNEKFCEITGYSRNELTSEFFDFSQLLIPKSKEIVEKRYQARLSGKDLPNIYEFEIITKNGKIKHVEISTNPLTSKDKPRILGIMRDVTERNQAQKLEQEVAVARRAAQFKQNFLANMSHEIRTPLTGVLGMTEMLAKTKLDKKQKDYVNVLYQSGENLKEIINLILDFSKIEAGKVTLNKKPFAPAVLLKSAVHLFAPLCRNGVVLNTSIDENVPPIIIADRQRLSQVINNLLSNAVKFTSKGSISLKISVQENGANNFADLDEIYLKTEVIDSGVGISPEIKEKLFLPFYQIEHELTGKFDGTGLGLAISRELVRLMGGDIEVESKVGEGSNFWFNFKAQVKKQIDDTEGDPETFTEIKSGRPLKILLVEDKDVNQKVIGLLLKSLNHKVVVAANGEDALRQYSPGKFDLILMDIKMPVMDGITATRELKELYPGVPPIIGLSASSFEGDREKYMKEGLDEYLTKPLDTEAFISLMQKLGLH